MTTEAKSVIENRLREKSLKNWKFRRYFADISVLDRNFGEWNTRARGWFFASKYRRYIGNIDKNIEDISRYIGNISK